MTSDGKTAQFLERWRAGDPDALREVVELVFDDLRGVAKHYMRKERSNHTLQTSGLLAEVYLKLFDIRPENTPANRGEFFAFAAKIMRHVLVDYARRKKALKRGGGQLNITLEEVTLLLGNNPDYIEELHGIIERFTDRYPRQMTVLDQKYFFGLKNKEIAEGLGCSLSTVKNDLLFAKRLLQREMAKE